MRVWSVLFLWCLLSGCKMGDVSSELQKTRDTLEKVSNTLSNAVPGEELRKLQMLAHGDDPVAAEKARTVIARLYGINPEEFDKEYSITVSVDTPGVDVSSPDAKPIRLGIAQIATNLSYSAELALKGDFLTMHELGASGWRSPVREEVEQMVRGKVAAASATLLGEPQPIIRGPGAEVGPHKFPTGLVEYRETDGGNRNSSLRGAINGGGELLAPGIKSEVQRKREGIDTYNAQLADAVLSAFSQLPTIPLQHRSITKAWDFRSGPYLLVAIDDESWKHYKGNILVRYSLHRVDNPEVTYNGMGLTTMPAGRFTAHSDGEPVVIRADHLSPVPDGKFNVRWGTANLIGVAVTPAYKEEVARQLNVYRAGLEKEEQEPWWKLW